MSVELPESKILAEQMNQKLIGKEVKSFQAKDCERLQKIGMMEKDLTVFNQLVDAKIETIASRGNVLRIKFDNGNNLIIGPEYGGEILYNTSTTDVPRFHLRLD
ncbi:MAG: DNA-formamidopyrimidine glycosylase family protein, partial [Candidatus Bathyarchaeota archaeon]